jgi:hypothetical protein
MKLQEYKKEQIFTEGFPQGDTLVPLYEVEFEDYVFPTEDGKEKKGTKLIFPDKKEHYCPKSVLKRLIELQEEGFKIARVTRDGTGKTDTKYVTVGIKNG